MDFQDISEYCLLKHFVTETDPFGPDTIVYKIKDIKIFCLYNIYKDPPFFNVKCHPQIIEDLREKYDCIKPGWHQDKKHWNSVYLKQAPDWLVKACIDHSYEIIVRKNTKHMKDLDKIRNTKYMKDIDKMKTLFKL